jgi:hypothetical protein
MWRATASAIETPFGMPLRRRSCRIRSVIAVKTARSSGFMVGVSLAFMRLFLVL